MTSLAPVNNSTTSSRLLINTRRKCINVMQLMSSKSYSCQMQRLQLLYSSCRLLCVVHTREAPEAKWQVKVPTSKNKAQELLGSLTVPTCPSTLYSVSSVNEQVSSLSHYNSVNNTPFIRNQLKLLNQLGTSNPSPLSVPLSTCSISRQSLLAYQAKLK